MSRFLDDVYLDYKLNIVDTREPDFKNSNPNITYTRGDFFKMKKEDFTSDAVINTDVLEHIPADLKIPFVNQCIDFAESLVVLSAPQDDIEVTIAEKTINNYYKKFAGKQQYWLKEHFEFGKPDPKKIEAAIKKKGFPYICVNTNNLENWLASFSINFSNSEMRGLAGMDELNRFYNENIHKVGDFEGKPYRKIFIIFKDKKLYDTAKQKIDEFFAPDSSKKNSFLMKSITVLVESYAVRVNEEKVLGKSFRELSTKLELTERNLKQTQDALVETSRELNQIKLTKAYRYANKAKKVLRNGA